ncbi:MAG: transglycosylase SLT domain-containing protein [Bdellovibrionia bacterium]
MEKFSHSTKWTVTLGSVILATGCAHVQKPWGESAGNSEGAEPKNISEVLLKGQNRTEGGSVEAFSPELYVQGVRLKNTQFDLPITINSRVEFWIDYFCGRGRAYFTKYLERSEYFIPYIAPLLKQNKMPEDLVYLAMIESGFNNLARSHAKAVGPWQFISATGKRYGLSVNWWIDERRDIRKSTLAAVEYLRDLYTLFQSWELAAAAYNAGESKVARAVRRYGSKDFWVISKHRFLRPETRDYVPKMFAAAIIAKNRAQFGFPESPLKPAADEAVAPDGEIVKVIKTDQPTADETYVEEKEADRELVSELSEMKLIDPQDGGGDGAESEKGIAQAEPSKGSGESAGDSLVEARSQGALGSQPLARPIPTPHVNRQGEVGGEELAEFEVQSPADMLKIAQAAGLSYQTVKNLNPEILRWCTPPTVPAYRVKLPVSVKDRFLVTYNHGAFPRKVNFLTYKVHRGETLHRIARHFGIKVDPMTDLNRVSPRVSLRSGTHVLLPMPNDRSRNLASLEVRDPPERRRYKRQRRSQRYYRIHMRHRDSARNFTPVSPEKG